MEPEPSDSSRDESKSPKSKPKERFGRRFSSVEKLDQTSDGKKVQKSAELPMSLSSTELSDSSWEIVETNQASDIQKLVKGDMPSQENIIFQTAAVAPEMKNANGNIILTTDAIWFHAKHTRPFLLVKVAWQNVTDFSKLRKKGFDKALRISAGSEGMIFASIKDRDTLLFFMKLLSTSAKSQVRTFGFSQKEDAEVATRIVPMQAPYVVESTVKKNLSDIMAAVREESTFHDILACAGCKDIVISQWTKTKNGIQRNVQYVFSSGQRTDVSSVQRLMKSGSACVFESADVFTRAAMGKVLESNSQFYFKQKEEVVNFRGALSVDWRMDTWDKEFVDAAIVRVNRISFNYMKSKFNEESFDVAKFNGQWRKHMPYVLVIGTLFLALIMLMFMPVDTDWYKFGAGLVIIVFFFLV